MKKAVPWWLKIPAKIVLSRLPIGYWFWRRLGLFRHGLMLDADYALKVFSIHADCIPCPDQPWHALELGPGDSLMSAVIAAAHGAASVTIVDVGKFALMDYRVYAEASARLRAAGLPAPDLSACTSMDEVLRACRARYLTDGVSSLATIPDGTIDFVWSQAVLEHVRLADFDPIMRELRRVLRDAGCCSHTIDLKDHLGGSLNSLRFSRARWESHLMSRSGFYTNRLRPPQLFAAFRAAGFAVEQRSAKRWESLPIPRQRLAEEYRAFDDDALRIHSMHVVLRPLTLIPG